VLSGADRMCFAVTEPDAGLDTTRLRTRAERRDGGYLVSGEKIWISVAQVATKMMLLARTTPREETARRTDGLSLFFTDLDRSRIEIRKIEKMGRHAVDSNLLFISDLWVPEEDRIGPEGEGFRIILHGLNPERILLGAEAVGLGQAAVSRAAAYARERIVFDRPIGMNQGIQHPLAKCWAQLEAASLMVMKAASQFDAGQDCGVAANAAKYLAGEAGFEACHTAMLTLGGMGYAQEYHVERYLREILIPRIAPVSPHMILNFLAEKALHLPRSY
jgi:acyl-CoA dehydrogenase